MQTHDLQQFVKNVHQNTLDQHSICAFMNTCQIPNRLDRYHVAPGHCFYCAKTRGLSSVLDAKFNSQRCHTLSMARVNYVVARVYDCAFTILKRWHMPAEPGDFLVTQSEKLVVYSKLCWQASRALGWWCCHEAKDFI